MVREARALGKIRRWEHARELAELYEGSVRRTVIGQPTVAQSVADSVAVATNKGSGLRNAKETPSLLN